ncbi:MAG: hypothetical protein OEW08_08385 [Gammaproteobacteria bacterium]|nr:hypothetical protein [Gammaproteobacteria bacterium]
MKTTLEFISDLKAKTGLDSDYAISKELGVTRNAISLYRTGKAFMGDETAMKVAKILDIDPGYVVACVHAEREKIPAVKAMWKHTAQALYGLAAVLAVVAILPFVSLPDSGLIPAVSAFDNNGYYALLNIHYANTIRAN